MNEEVYTHTVDTHQREKVEPGTVDPETCDHDYEDISPYQSVCIICGNEVEDIPDYSQEGE